MFNQEKLSKLAVKLSADEIIKILDLDINEELAEKVNNILEVSLLTFREDGNIDLKDTEKKVYLAILSIFISSKIIDENEAPIAYKIFLSDERDYINLTNVVELNKIIVNSIGNMKNEIFFEETIAIDIDFLTENMFEVVKSVDSFINRINLYTFESAKKLLKYKIDENDKVSYRGDRDYEYFVIKDNKLISKKKTLSYNPIKNKII